MRRFFFFPFLKTFLLKTPGNRKSKFFQGDDTCREKALFSVLQKPCFDLARTQTSTNSHFMHCIVVLYIRALPCSSRHEIHSKRQTLPDPNMGEQFLLREEEKQKSHILFWHSFCNGQEILRKHLWKVTKSQPTLICAAKFLATLLLVLWERCSL